MRALLTAAALLAFVSPALADVATTSTGSGVTVADGAAVFQHVCQGCHQANAMGAEGAGAKFPALANNPKLETAGYPISMIENGHGGMPWFNGMLTDAQVAAVVNYVRSHFGNTYTDAVTEADVKSSHGPPPTLER